MTERKQWTFEECTNLIEAYRDHQHLWKTSHSDYKNKMKKYDSYKEIAETFGTTSHEILRKIKNIVSQYQRERRNCEKLKHSGQFFKSSWFGYAAMSFLHEENKDENDRHINGLDFEDSASCNSQFEKEGTPKNYDIQDTLLDVLKQSPDHQSTQPAETSTQIENQKRFIYPPVLPKIIQIRPKTTYNSLEAFQKINNNNTFEKTQNDHQERDEFCIYGELVGHKIRKLKTEYSRATVEHMINNILYDAQLGKYDVP